MVAPADSRLGKEYRLPRSYFRLGLGLTVGFLTIGGVSVWAALTNVDGSFRFPVETATVFAVWWGLMALLGVYVMWASVVERLLLWEDRVRCVGSFRTREVRLADVTRAAWHIGPAGGGSLVLHGPGGKVTVNFPQIEMPARLAVRDYFRTTIPESLQDGWAKYALFYEPTPERIEKARRTEKWLYAVLAVVGAGMVVLGVVVDDDSAERWKIIIFGGLQAVISVYLFIRSWRSTAATDGPPVQSPP